MSLDRSTIRPGYQTKEVAPGESAVVWYYRVGGGYKAFVRKIACNWYPDTYYEFSIDGDLIEKVERTIEMTEPDEYDPPFVAEKRIIWKFFNNSSNAITTGVLCSGDLARPAVRAGVF